MKIFLLFALFAVLFCLAVSPGIASMKESPPGKCLVVQGTATDIQVDQSNIICGATVQLSPHVYSVDVVIVQEDLTAVQHETLNMIPYRPEQLFSHQNYSDMGITSSKQLIRPLPGRVANYFDYGTSPGITRRPDGKSAVYCRKT